MHVIVAIMESLPSVRNSNNYIDKFLNIICAKRYNAKNNGKGIESSWDRIRPREIRFFDFIIPEEAEQEVLSDLSPYFGGKIQKIQNIANKPFIGTIISKLTNLQPFDFSCVKMSTNACTNVYISLIGKVLDEKDEKGRELL